jgi:hypothetical protein
MARDHREHRAKRRIAWQTLGESAKKRECQTPEGQLALSLFAITYYLQKT